MFSRNASHMEDAFVNIFSVMSQSPYPSIKNRVVVEHTGSDNREGEWRCWKDSKMVNCGHIIEARHTLQRYLQGDPNALDLNASRGIQGTQMFVSLGLC